MRVMLTTDCVGGVWTFTKEMTTELLERGHAVALISVGRLPSADQARWCGEVVAKFPQVFRFEALPVALEWEQGNVASYAGAEAALLRCAKDFAADVLHSSQFCFGKLPVDVPKVITAHSDVLSWADACRPEGFQTTPWLQQYEALVEDGLAAVDALVAPTMWMLGALRRHYTLPVTQAVIANGRTLSRATQGKERQLQAVSVGRLWDEAKNTRLLTRIDPPMPILVAGETMFGVEAAALGSLKALGVLGEDALFEIFRGSSVYLAPAVYEPFGLAPLEAALCGCAVVANNIPSLREVWGQAALYFDDAASLTRLLQELVAAPEVLATARERSLARAWQFTAERMVDEYLALYGSLVKRAAGVPEKEPAAYAA